MTDLERLRSELADAAMAWVRCQREIESSVKDIGHADFAEFTRAFREAEAACAKMRDLAAKIEKLT